MTLPHRRKARSLRLVVETLEGRDLLAAMVALTAQNQLLQFDSARPDVTQATVTISGLAQGETILAIDDRPATGQLYGLGSTGRLYVINPNTGASRLVAPDPIAAPLSGHRFDLAFDPVDDTLRVISDAGQDLSLDPNTAAVTTDGTPAYAPSDPGSPTTPLLIGEAYSGASGAPVTTLFGIDAARGTLVTQGSIGGASTPPNSGELFTVGPLGVSTGTTGSFAFTPDGQALAVFNPDDGRSPALYAINLGSGSAQFVGNFAHNSPILGVAALPRDETVYAVTASSQLVSFHAATPDQLLTAKNIRGLAAGESLAAIAFRPATGGLYGLGTSGHFYAIDPASATAMPLGPALYGASSPSAKVSLAFDPTTDQFRMVDDQGKDLRGDPSTGNLVAIDPALAYDPTDPAAGIPPHVVAEAYSNPTPGASSTTLYAIDSLRDALATQGSVGGSPSSPNSGLLTEVATDGQTPSLGLAVGDLASLSFAPDGRALALLTPQSTNTPALAMIDPTTGAATVIGPIAGGSLVSLAVAPAGLAGFSAASYTVVPAAGLATITVARSDGSSGPGRVAFATADGSAHAGTNYTATSGILNFADGQTSQTFTIPLAPAPPGQPATTIHLALAPVANGLAIGPLSAAVLTIAPPAATATLASTLFVGPATALSGVVLTFSGPIDPLAAQNAANFAIGGTASLGVVSSTYDPTANAVTLNFASPVALARLSTLQITIAAPVAGSQLAANFTVLHGRTVRYADADADRVALSVSGKGASLDLIRSASGEGLQAWVEGPGKVITGSLRARSGSNHKTTLARLATHGAKLRLPRSFAIGQVVTTG